MPSLHQLACPGGEGLCGAAWGWRVGTKGLYRCSVFHDDDDDRGARGWRRRVRLANYLTTVGYALLSALMVLIVMTTFRRWQRRLRQPLRASISPASSPPLVSR